MTSRGSIWRSTVVALAVAVSLPSAAAAQAAAAATPPSRQPALRLRSTTNADRELAAARARQRAGRPLSPGQRKLLEKAGPAKTPAAPAAKGRASSSAMNGAAGALLDMVLGQVGTADLFAVPNFANSPLPIATCECAGGILGCDPTAPPAPALGCIKDADCPGFASGATCTGPVVAGGIRKFVDQLAPLCAVGKNNLGQCLPIAVPDRAKFQNSDYYEIGVKDYRAQFHSDLPKAAPATPATPATGTQVRGYYQKNAPAGSDPADSHYLGPIILATRGRPVRVLMTNEVAAGPAGNLFIPVDHTIVGAGLGPLDAAGQPCNPLDPAQAPNCASYTENRATFHLHGGNTPWISDGTQHQWTAPAGEVTPFQKGLVTRDVPDMPTGPGQMSFYWTNDQSGRLMFYHDHAYGITRLNVYAGEAAGYVLIDPVEEDAMAAATVPGTLGAAFDVAHYMPLVIQDKTFVPPAEQLAAEDPTWDPAKWGSTGNFWFPHVYPPNQWPDAPDLSGANPFGRWDYGPWFHPAQTVLTAGQVEVPCYTAGKPGPVGVPNTKCPGIPNPTIVPESFLDTPMINGTVYPTVTVDPTAYRFQVLNAAQERNWNLSLFVADASGTEVPMVDAVPPSATTKYPKCGPAMALSAVTGLPVGPDLATPPCYPASWPTDGRVGGVPDPAAAGPAIWQLGSEGGLLPSAVQIPPMPVGYEYNRRNIVVLNVLNKALFMGPAERADVVVDFSAYAGKTLILYNDAPAPVPAFDTRFDYFTGAPDQTSTGGAPTTHPGYGPNTRTVMQIKVRSGPVNKSFNPTTASSALKTLFVSQQQAPVIPEAAYSGMYPAGTLTSTYFSAQATGATVTPIDTVTAANPAGTPYTFTFGQKAIQELFDPDYGRMNATLGVEMPLTNFLNQTTVPYANFDPATEFLEDTKPHIWKITHNGVDTHTIHFHLLNLQIVNRVGWDGAVRAPDANEMGWKESIRMHPLEDIYVAMRPVKMAALPWPLPDMWRPLDVTLPLGTATQFTGVDAMNNPVAVSNQVQNFGWEYVWHCHLLGHEENDMLRAEIFVTAPEAPQALTAAATVNGAAADVKLAWNDASLSAMSFVVQRSTDPLFGAVDLNTTVAAVAQNAFVPGVPVATANTLADTIPAFDPALTYYYRVQAQKQLSSVAYPASMQGSAAIPYRASSAWVVASLGTAPQAAVSPNALAFGAVPVLTSASLVATVTNSGAGTLIVGGVTLAGSAHFSQASGCGVVAPGASCAVTVTYAPLAVGADAGTLTISTNDPAATTLTVALSGSGVTPIASLAPAGLFFGPQLVGTTSPAQTVTLTNAGALPLAIAGGTLGGASPADFAVGTTCGASLAAGASCTYALTFTPSAVGARAATLTVATNDPFNPVQAVTLAGTGTAPGIVVAPLALDFGSLLVNNLSAAQTATVTNNGTSPLVISSVALTGGSAGQFTLASLCGPSLATGASCTFSVVFRPTAVGPATAAVTILSSSLATPSLAVPLTGTGLGLNLSATSVAFGNQLVGTVSAATTLTLSNASTAAVTLGAPALGGANAGDFRFTTTCGATLAAGASCRVSLRFAPTTTGVRTGAIAIPTSLSAIPLSVALSGTGVAPVLSLAPAALTFPSQVVGISSAPQSVTVSNVGDATLAITGITLGGANPAQFARTTTCGATLAAGASCTVSLTFTPNNATARAATLAVNVGAPAVSGSVALSGTSATPVLALAPASLAFPNQPVGVSSAPQVATVSNTGNGPMTITGITVGGANPAQFARTTTCGATLAAGASCTVSVTFTPNNATARAATLAVNVAAPAVSGTVALSGTAAAPVLGLSPTALAFGAVTRGTVSPASTVTLSNTGNAALAIAGITLGGANANQFRQTSACPATLAAGASCTVSVTFAPTNGTARGNKTASLSINVAGPNGTVALTGTAQ